MIPLITFTPSFPVSRLTGPFHHSVGGIATLKSSRFWPTRYINYKVDTTHLASNESPDSLSDAKYISSWPAPDTSAKCAAGEGVLRAVVDTWSESTPTCNYTSKYPYDAADGIDTAGIW